MGTLAVAARGYKARVLRVKTYVLRVQSSVQERVLRVRSRFESHLNALARGDSWWLVSEFHRRWQDNRLSGLSAEVAFYAILSLFPAAIVFVSALGFLDAMISVNSTTSIQEWANIWVAEVFGTDNSLQETVKGLFTSPRSGLITFSMLLGTYTSSRCFRVLVRALDMVYTPDNRRGWLPAQLVGFILTLVTLATAAILAAMISAGPLLGRGVGLAERVGIGSTVIAVWSWLRWPAAFISIVAWVASVYCFVPKRDCLKSNGWGHTWRQGLASAMLTVLWWACATLLFSVYIAFASAGANVVLGVLGGALSLLLWLYLLAMGFLVGATLDSVKIIYTQRNRSR